LLQLVAREGIHPIIGQVYPLSEASAALTSLESRGTYGKLLLKP
jgi:NADPH:quinone reductase-like Zn-dependent oxidoreductase